MPIALLAHAKWAEADRLAVELEQRTQERDEALDALEVTRGGVVGKIEAEERVRELEAALREARACLPDAMHPSISARHADGIVAAQVILAAALGDEDPGNVASARAFASEVLRRDA